MTSAVLPLAWRNIWRYPRRSVLTIMAIAMGLTALLLLWGIRDGIHHTMIRNFQATFIGSLQIQHQGFRTRPTLDKHVQETPALRAALARFPDLPWTRRLQSAAIAAGAQTSMGAVLVGVETAQEAVVSRLAAKLVQGRLLSAQDTDACVLGVVSARLLGVTLGEPVTVLAQGADGSLAAERLTLVGVLDTGAQEIDHSMVLAPLATVQAMLSLEGRWTQLVMLVPEARLAQVAHDLRAALSDTGVEVQRWDELFPLMREWIKLDHEVYYIFLGVVLVIVITGVVNTVLTSMLERQREFGILMALGTQPVAIGAIVASEALLLGGGGIGLGSLLGVGLVHVYGQVGIDLSWMSGLLARFYIDAVIYPVLNTAHLQRTLLALLLATTVAALYPAWRAVRLQPAEVLAHG